MFLVIVKYIILTSDTLELVQYGVIFLINLTVKRLDCELMPSLRENDLESASSIICFVRIATKILNTQRKLLPCISYFSFSLRSASVTLLQWEEICLVQLSVLVNLLSLYRVYVYRDDVFLLSRDIYIIKDNCPVEESELSLQFSFYPLPWAFILSTMYS